MTKFQIFLNYYNPFSKNNNKINKKMFKIIKMIIHYLKKYKF